jgi:hypothetical protein
MPQAKQTDGSGLWLHGCLAILACSVLRPQQGFALVRLMHQFESMSMRGKGQNE